MTDRANRFAAINAPREAVGGVRGNVLLAIDDTDQSFTIPEEWKGTTIVISVTGDDVQWTLGDSSVSVTFNQASASTTSTNDATGGILKATDPPRQVYIPKALAITDFAARCLATESARLFANPAAE